MIYNVKRNENWRRSEIRISTEKTIEKSNKISALLNSHTFKLTHYFEWNLRDYFLLKNKGKFLTVTWEAVGLPNTKSKPGKIFISPSTYMTHKNSSSYRFVRKYVFATKWVRSFFLPVPNFGNNGSAYELVSQRKKPNVSKYQRNTSLNLT